MLHSRYGTHKIHDTLCLSYMCCCYVKTTTLLSVVHKNKSLTGMTSDYEYCDYSTIIVSLIFVVLNDII
jgi:hypothetical protein